MKNRAVKILLVLIGLLVAAVAIGRLAAGAVVGSSDFPAFAGRELERALRGIVPRTLVTVKAARLAGLATLVLENIEVRSEDKISTPLNVQAISVEIDPPSVFGSGPARFNCTAEVAPKGQVKAVVSVPVLRLWRGSTEPLEVGIVGQVNSLDASAFGALLAPENDGGAFRLARGTVNGSFRVARRLSRQGDSGGRNGGAELSLDNMVWEVAEEKLASPAGGVGNAKSNFAFEETKIRLDVHDADVSLKEPVVFASAAHRATFSGGLVLPSRADRDLAWKLAVTTNGSATFKAAIARLLRCKISPVTNNFRVAGPIKATSCVKDF